VVKFKPIYTVCGKLMSQDYKQFEQRKQDHIDLALMQANQALELNPFDSIQLQHEALPDINFEDIDISGSRFGRKVSKPFIISSMTAGHKDAVNINRNLIAACSENEWAMGVGSQRRELTDNHAAQEWSLIRKDFPNVQLYSNLGIAQLISSPVDDIKRLTDALGAMGLIIHCNPLQECIQPEGTTRFKGGLDAIEHVASALSIPIIVKETGCGFSTETLHRLNQVGVRVVDVSGLGGTHWGRIEGHRAGEDSIRSIAAETFKNWGIDTVQSVKNAISLNPSFEVWGSGGVRNGLDAAKLFALGASTVGFAKPMLKAALVSSTAVLQQMATFEYELKVAMFCTGSLVLNDLKEKGCR
jgi:isopentenyl-diphosphate Delta-isomerase